MGAAPSVSTGKDAPDTFEYKSGVKGGSIDENLAAMHMQSWCRRKISRRRKSKKLTWKLHSHIEYQNEVASLQLHRMFCNLKVLQECLERNAGLPHDSLTDVTLPSIDDGTEDDSSIKNLRSGPMGLDPADFDKDDVIRVIDRLQKGEKMSIGVVKSLIVRAYRLNSKKYPTIRELNTTTSGNCVVVGDLHGQLADLLLIFEKAGLPSSSNPYVFNGDFVDRGDKGLEITCILIMFQLLYPDHVFINRGNHEDFLINKQFGFEQEVLNKYAGKDAREHEKKQAAKLLQCTACFFSSLPLGVLIGNDKLGNGVCVLHGGITKDIKLSELREVRREKFGSIMHTALILNGAMEGTLSNDMDFEQAGLIVGVTWSDPQQKKGFKFNNKRGCGVYFGPDITAKFLSDHKLKYLVRSHECVEDGYYTTHDGKLITVFSASDYYGENSNQGAFIRFDKNLEPHYFTFCGYHERKALPSTDVVEGAALENVHATILRYKKDLLIAFEAKDPQRTRSIKTSEWCDVMSKITNLDLPWSLLVKHLVSKNEDTPGHVLYLSTLSRMSLKSQRVRSKSIAESLYKNLDALQYIFRLMDKDGSGSIEISEFVEAMLLMSKHLEGREISRETAEEMAAAVDLDHNGEIDFNEFVESFRLIETKSEESEVNAMIEEVDAAG